MNRVCRRNSILFLVIPIALSFLASCSFKGQVDSAQSQRGTVRKEQGDSSKKGGSPTIREEFESLPDDPETTNDESNDQPLGHFGTVSLRATGESGNTYTLDADLDGNSLERLYFPKGGWVDFYSCDLDDDLTGECVDEEGRSWIIHGEE